MSAEVCRASAASAVRTAQSQLAFLVSAFLTLGCCAQLCQAQSQQDGTSRWLLGKGKAVEVGDIYRCQGQPHLEKTGEVVTASTGKLLFSAHYVG